MNDTINQKNITCEQEITFPINKANFISIFVFLVLVVTIGIPFFFVHKQVLISFANHLFSFLKTLTFTSLLRWMIHKLIIFILVMFASILLHEGIHGLFFLFFSRMLKAIRFGIMWEHLTPYAHCIVALKKSQYNVSALAPFFIMGLLPIVFAFLDGQIIYLVFGILLTWASTGDFISVWLSHSLPKHSYLLDHPQQLGFFVVKPS